MTNVNGIDIQAFLKKVNQGGKANIGEAANLLTEQKSNLTSVFSNANVATAINKIDKSDLFNIAHTALNNVVMTDNNAELNEKELNCAIQDIEEKIVECAKKLESQERQEMGLTEDVDKEKNVKAEESDTAENVSPAKEFGDAEKEVPSNVRNAVDRTMEELAEELAQFKNCNKESYAECDADGVIIRKIHKKYLYKTDGIHSGHVTIDRNSGRHVKAVDAIQLYAEYEYKGKLYKSNVYEKPLDHVRSVGMGSHIEVVDDEPEFE